MQTGVGGLDVLGLLIKMQMKKQAKNNTREYSSKIYLTSKKVTHVSRKK